MPDLTTRIAGWKRGGLHDGTPQGFIDDLIAEAERLRAEVEKRWAEMEHYEAQALKAYSAGAHAAYEKAAKVAELPRWADSWATEETARNIATAIRGLKDA